MDYNETEFLEREKVADLVLAYTEREMAEKGFRENQVYQVLGENAGHSGAWIYGLVHSSRKFVGFNDADKLLIACGYDGWTYRFDLRVYSGAERRREKNRLRKQRNRAMKKEA